MKNLTPELYVDALGGVMLGYPICKLTFVTISHGNGNAQDSSSVSESDDTSNVAKNNAITITIPTAALIDACQKIIENLKENEQGLVAAQEKTAKLMEALLSKS